MSKKDDFYIGWQNEMPKTNKKRIRQFIIPIFLIIPLLAIGIVWQQKTFNDHEFELGSVKPIKGIYLNDPVPMLLADPGQLPEGLSPYILLVGYGKFGAEGIMEAIEGENQSLHSRAVTLQGTLIYGDGKAVMELTKQEKSLVKAGESKVVPNATQPAATEQTLNGEILDPKCYFGVMKPGEGKIHKSCAIRCISGGIPPVFRVARSGQKQGFDYYLLLGANNEKINDDVLDYIGESIQVVGKTVEYKGWNVLQVDISNEQTIQSL